MIELQCGFSGLRVDIYLICVHPWQGYQYLEEVDSMATMHLRESPLHTLGRGSTGCRAAANWAFRGTDAGNANAGSKLFLVPC